MADVLRSCTKTGCRWPAAASLSYRYATRQVWLLDLSPATDPSLYDLCPHHADHLVVPKGWERVDDRTPQEVMVEPSAFDRAEAARSRQPTTISARSRELVSAGSSGPRNRYAELVEQLPRLAAEAHASDAARYAIADPAGEVDEVKDPAAPAPDADRDDRAASADAARQQIEPPPADVSPPATTAPAPPVTTAATPPPARPVVPSRELAPMPAGEPLWREATPAPAPLQQDLIADPLPGQLAIPVDDLIESSGGVVVAFDLAGRTAGGRRRTPRS